MVEIPASRPLGLYSDSYWLMYLLVAAAVCACAAGLLQRVRSWRLGTGALNDRLNRPGARFTFLCANLFGQSRILRRHSTGMPHALMFWGFLVFVLGTVSLMLQEDFGLPTFQGPYYLGLTLLMDLFAVFALAGILMSVWRRWVARPEGLITEFEDGLLLALLGGLLASGLLLEGMRIAMVTDPWAAWSPAGAFIARLLGSQESGRLASFHQGTWWLHLLFCAGFIALIPWTKLLHLVTAPASQFFGDPRAAVALAPIDFDDEALADVGIAHLEDLHWKQLLELDACLKCGRCHDRCPAVAAGKTLSPQKMNLDIKRHLYARVGGSADAEKIALVDEVVTETDLWACTTCRACETHCPVVVEHVPRTVGLRRNRVMMEACFPQELQQAFRGMETNYNPWNLDRDSRADWARELDAPLLKDQPDAEYLYWPGCAGAFDARNQKVAKAMVEILNRAQVGFAILGSEERCCGDSARRLGNEYLFQSLALANVETLNGHRVRKIITSCPHCFNTFKNEYPSFGGDFEVIPHVTMIDRLIRSGQVRPGGSVSGETLRLSYHDPCYLARYNHVMAPPRAVLGAIGDAELVELEQNREAGFCCGGGGGRMWLEDKDGRGINLERAGQVVANGTQLLVTGCPFCLTMMTDGLKSLGEEESIPVRDMAEIVAEASAPC